MQKALDPTTVPLIERATNPLSKKYVTKMFYHRRRTILICCILCSVLVFLFVMGTVLEIMPEFNQYRLVKKYAQYPTTNRGSTRTILFWNSFFGNKRWSLPEDTLGPAYFRDDLLCPVYKCEITNVKDFLPSVDMYDAIVFHTAEPFYWIESVPAKRADNQFYVFALMEPPGETKHVLNDENYFYNLTMTYRLDSDILWPYMYFFDKTNSAIVAPTAKSAPIWREPPDEYNNTAIWNLWSGKNKTAAWFVSHCNTLSQREQLAEALQNFVDVDIYGECGDLSCPYKESECDEMLDKEYKFYLSFENSLCRDYVTEKIYNALRRQVIPIVYGGANYELFLPPRSYINAEEFESVEQLAMYLKYLSTHPKEYLRYFWWREHYKLGYFSPFCELCAQLHSVTNQQKTQTYRNIEQWWLGDSCRLTPRIKI